RTCLSAFLVIEAMYADKNLLASSSYKLPFTSRVNVGSRAVSSSCRALLIIFTYIPLFNIQRTYFYYTLILEIFSTAVLSSGAQSSPNKSCGDTHFIDLCSVNVGSPSNNLQ